MLARAIDRSTGSPLTRWLLTAALALLPVLTFLAGGGNPPFGDVQSSSATVASLLLLGPAVGALITVTVTIAWRVDRRFLEVLEVSPLPTARWQLALLIPGMAMA